MTAPFRVELLARHDHSTFDSGVEPLDTYLRSQASQDARRRVTTVFVAIDQANEHIAGYYTLAACSVDLGELPPELMKRLPRYPSVPAVRIGRLAVDRSYRGRKLGAALLFDAIRRTAASPIAAFALVVDAKDAAAVAFYEHHGFVQFAKQERVLFLPISEGLRRLVSLP